MKTLKSLIIIGLSLLIQFQLKGQKRDTLISRGLDKKGDSITVIEVIPQFIGGSGELFKYLNNNIHYPINALKHGARGRVIVGFIIDKDGSVTDVKLKQIDKYFFSNRKERKKEEKIPEEIYQELIDECLRVVKSMPNWLPATQQGKPVRVAYTLPIKCYLK